MRLGALLPTAEQLSGKLLLPEQRIELEPLLSDWLQRWGRFDLLGGFDAALLRRAVRQRSERAVVHGLDDVRGRRRRRVTLKGYLTTSATH